MRLPSRHSPNRPPVVAAVFGSGGARGLAHLGVLQALAELGLEPDIVAGTSIGSVVAAAYATGCVEKICGELPAFNVLEASRLFLEPGIRGSGLIEGRHVMDKLGTWIPNVDIRHLRIPYAAVAFDIVSQREVVFDSGNIHDAIRASISIPGVFTPVRHGTGWLVDGALSNPLPVDLARAMGAERVLAVDINLTSGAPAVATPPNRTVARLRNAVTRGAPTLFEVITQSIRICENAIERERLQKDVPDVLLSPAVGHINSLDFRNMPSSVQAGYQCAMEHAADLKALFTH